MTQRLKRTKAISVSKCGNTIASPLPPGAAAASDASMYFFPDVISYKKCI